ncbi:MerR family transcriptional regulator [Rhodococcus sp. X156]|uniref:MerR family transcriptional regulator n=1 Tax=Rhodococcus sp. X156 TaxID=2499145 RepID=UPI000FD71ECA|nr:MerR family transcriptional regulator [Rhodococcus sp. X156]
MTEHRIDELARLGGTTVRNVRVYQDRGLLPPPRKQGRTGWYSDSHLARLRLIGRLLDRGYTFATINELLTAVAQGWRVEDLLDIEQELAEPWTDERPRRMSALELRRMFGKEASRAVLQRGCEIGLLTRQGTGYLVNSPRLLAAGRDLVTAGIPIDAVLDLAEALQHDMARVAERFVDLLAGHVLPDDGRPLASSTEQLNEIAALIHQLRPHAAQAVDATFGRAMKEATAAAFDAAASRLTEGPAAEEQRDERETPSSD